MLFRSPTAEAVTDDAVSNPLVTVATTGTKPDVNGMPFGSASITWKLATFGVPIAATTPAVTTAASAAAGTVFVEVASVVLTAACVVPELR